MQDSERGQRIRERRMELHLTQPAVVEKIEELAWKLPRDHALQPANAAGEDGTPRAPLSLRGLQTYERGGGIVWEKAKLLAQVLQMDPHVMMHGLDGEDDPESESTPDLLGMASPDAGLADRLDAIERSLARIEQALGVDQTPSTDVDESAKRLLVAAAAASRAFRDASRGTASNPGPQAT